MRAGGFRTMKTLYHRTERERWGRHQRLTAPSFWTGAYLLLIALAVLIVPTVVWAVRPILNEAGAAGAGAGGMGALMKTITEIGKQFEQFRAVNTGRLDDVKQRLDELEAGGAASGEVARLRDRIEELEARASTPGVSRASKVDPGHARVFCNWLRRPQDPAAMEELGNAERASRNPVIRADVTIGTGAAGGFAVPEEIAREMGRLELLFSPVRRLVKVRQVGTSDYKELISKRGATSGWVGETGSRTATLTPQLRERAPTHGELYAYPQASNWSLDDIFFDVGQWLAEELAQVFSREEGIAVISGNGTNRPTGMTNTAPVATADFASPERSANAYQLVASDLTPGGVGIVADALVDLFFTLAQEYRARSTWVMSSATAAAVRKLKDPQGQYIWQQGLIAGQPDLLLGRPVEVWENMPAIGANNFPVAIGDWQRAYILAHRGVDRITVDQVTAPGFTKYYVRRRVGGHVLDNHAAKFLQTL
jgi:HK97 family phage major capsid protein